MNIKDLGQDYNIQSAPMPTNINDLKGNFTSQQSNAPTAPHPDLLQKAGNFVNSIFPGKQVGEAIGTLGGYLASPNKSTYDTSAPSPLQVAGDVAKGGAMVAGFKAPIPATVLGQTAMGAGLGALGGAGQSAVNTSGSAIPTRQDLGQVAKGGVIGGAVGGTLAGATGLIGKALQSTGDKIQMTAIKPSQADIKDGFSIDTIKKYDLGGSLSTVYDKTQAKMNDLTQQLNEKLAGSDSSIDLNEVYKNTEKALSTNSLKSFGSNTSVSNALKQLQGEISNVSQDGGMSIPEAQLVKQASGRMGAWQFGISDPEATARETVYNAFYNQLKKSIEDNSPAGVKGINQELSKLIPVSNAVLRRIPIAERNSALSLTDMMTATASIFNPHALVGLGISLAQKEGSVGNLLSKAAPAVGNIGARSAGLAGTAGSAISP